MAVELQSVDSEIQWPPRAVQILLTAILSSLNQLLEAVCRCESSASDLVFKNL